ncbi:hypothetical protein Vretifemale_5346 [Volvox reticuliferus]|uniref:Inner centromere protein ARK-binding domain-containing protein n=1 Tax=Volvox reticuliferus TaxID=1737510 RepID=A0A8J4C4W5_9CHLO|nr:hypothetical protein Vretifemale_5346 [Volvox reticuliferus]
MTMAAAKKVLVTRFQDILSNRQEERRIVEELANGLREDVQNLVAQASQSVYQLRGRTVVITTPEGSRRKKAARTNDPQETKSGFPAGAEEERKVGGPAGPVGPVPAGGLEQPLQAGTGRSDAQERQDAEPAEPDASTAQSGQKRGRSRAGGGSQAKSKRAKAQVAQSVPAERSDAAAAADHGTSQQPSTDAPTIAAKQIDVAAEAAASIQRQPISVPAAQLEDPADKGARRTRNRVQKQAAKQAPRRSHTGAEACQPESAAAASGPPISVAFSPRVTRARRAQPAANRQCAAAPVAAKPTGGRSARQKRDMAEAQLGSPGVHPKTKPATVSGTSVPPMAAVNASSAAAAVTPPLNVDPAATSKQANIGMSPCAANVKLMQVAKATPRPGACPSARGTYPSVGPQARETDSSSPLPPTDKPDADLRKGEPDNMARQPAAMATMQPDAGQAVCAKGSGKVRSASSQPENRMHGQHPPSEKTVVAPPDNVRRMGAHIAAAIAMFCGKTGPAATGPSCTSKVENAKLDPTGANAHNDHTCKGPTGGMASASGPTEGTNSSEQFFSFGTKPKEQSSPPMPHFGPAVEQVTTACDVMTVTAIPEEGYNGTPEKLPTEADSPDMSVHGSEASVLGAESLNAEEQTAACKPLDEVPEAGILGDADVPDVVGECVSCGGEANNEAYLEAAVRGEVRNRSLSLSLAPQSPQSPIVLVAGAAINTHQAAVDNVEPGDIGYPRRSDDDVDKWKTSQEQLSTMDGDVEDVVDDGVDGAFKVQPPEPESSLCGALGECAEVGSEDAAVGCEAEGMQAGFGGKADDGSGEADDFEGPVAWGGSGVDTCTSTGPAASVLAGVQSGEAQSSLKSGGVGAAMPAQLNKPKGGNLVSSIRSFLPQRTAPSPAPAAGKKAVKVKALEAAQAVKQKEAARQAERALARAAAVERQRQGQGDAEPSNAKPGTQVPGSVRLTPTKSFTQQGADHVATCTTEGATGGVSTASVGSVLAKAAFFQLKEEQNKKAAVDLGAGRKPAGGATAALQPGALGVVPSYKTGANARAALAAGDNEAALTASAAASAPALMPASAANPSLAAAASSRGLNPVPVAAPSETVADKQKRVEAKRREEEERRRAELEARTKAKDDKMRNIEAAKQQQRQGGGGGAPRPPPPLIPNPFAAQLMGKRPPLNGSGACSGPAAAGQVKPEPESNKIGPAGPSAARTPGQKLGTAKTPAPKAAPLACNMVSPAVQMQIKLLPAVHAQGPAADGIKAVACAPGLPKPRPGGVAKQAPGEALAAAAAYQHTTNDSDMTPGAGDLTEEERRNVHAIQTSPYIMQVKPRTPGMPTSTKPAYANYEISPYRSDSDSDDDEEEQSRRGKPVPPWAAYEKILLAVQAQSGINPDTIFGTYPSTIDLVRVFSDMPPPGKTDARGRPRRDYRRRGSSGIWDADMF